MVDHDNRRGGCLLVADDEGDENIASSISGSGAAPLPVDEMAGMEMRATEPRGNEGF